MSKLSDAIAAIEAANESLVAQCDKQEERIAKQTGAILENRARIAQLDKIIQRQATLIANYQSFFRALGHGAADIKQQEANVSVVTGSGVEGHAERRHSKSPEGLRFDIHPHKGPTGTPETALAGIKPGLPLTADKPSSLTERIARATNGHAA